MIKHHERFPKPAEDYDSIRVWGENIVTAPSEGYEWKKHRYPFSMGYGESRH